MDEIEVRSGYFSWMMDQISDTDTPDIFIYTNLLSYLDSVDFEYLMPLDGNRAEDGIKLRYIYSERYGYDSSIAIDILDRGPCSILEMMVALAKRCEDTIMHNPDHGNRTSIWFWGMITSLGLLEMDDVNFDIVIIDDILDRFLNREYSPDGKGGLFTIPNCDKDLTKVEIWYQMCQYLNVFYTESEY